MSAAFRVAFNDLLENGEAKPEFDKNDPNYHFYDVEGAICNLSTVCSLEKVALENRKSPAPGTLSRTNPVRSGDKSLAHLGYDSKFDDFGPVLHTVSEDGFVVRNITLPGHRLYPGYVERRVFIRDNNVFIRTIGEGTGPMGAINAALAVPMWNGLVNSHIRYRINLGYRYEQ